MCAPTVKSTLRRRHETLWRGQLVTDDGALSTAAIAGNFPSEVHVYIGKAARFFDATIPNNPDFITEDERVVRDHRRFLLDVQAHVVSRDAELVEGGQLLALFVDPRIGG